MKSGVVLIARNNSEIDYIKQAVFLAERVRKYLDLPTSIITDNKDYLEKNYPNHIFEKIIEVESNNQYSYKKYNDGTFTRKSLEFKNTSRSSVYDLTPYDETLLLDTDYIISNDIFKKCFEQAHDFLIFKDGVELSGWRDLSEFDKITQAGPDFYWATAIFFRKTNLNRIFFDLVKHIQENWLHYRNLYQIHTTVFRNDHVFSIAIHTMNGFIKNNFAHPMPGKLFYITDRDLLVDLDEDTFLVLIEKEKSHGKYFALKLKGSNLHVMNKFSLNRIIDNA
jgi:hypothetical protein